MLRSIRFALGLVLILSVSPGSVRAQGWGWGGWGGWGQTPEGAYAQGMGFYAQGLGSYNLSTAQARSINTDTFMRWNQYLYEAHIESTRHYVAKRDGDAAKNKATYNEIMKNIQDHPTARDVENGDALNAALDQLSDPRISSSSLKIATAPIPAEIVKDIPFHNASEAVTIILSQVKEAKKWPAALDGERFADDKKVFEEIADKARKEDEEGEIAPDTLKKAHDLVSSLQGKLATQPLETVKASQEASRFVKTLSGLVRMLEKPDTKAALDQLKMVKTTTLGNLIAFMHIYNMRFGAATNPHQKLIYDQLYPLLDDVRDRVTKESRSETAAAANPEHAGDFFNKVEVDQPAGKNKEAPQPPNPQQ
jgi:hypothetical protein